jgi:hypothetical protein
MSDSNILLRNFAYLHYADQHVIKLCCSLILQYGASPFYIKDGKTTFEIAIENNNIDMITTYLHLWAMFPNWKLHDIIYSLMDNKIMIRYFESVLKLYVNKHALVNHALTAIELILLV